jgi:Raf-like Ras-binding domain
MSSRDETEKSYNVPLPDNNYVTVYLRDSMTNEEFLASACIRKNLNPMEHFVRVKKRREMEDHNYFVPHRNDLIETYVSPRPANECSKDAECWTQTKFQSYSTALHASQALTDRTLKSNRFHLIQFSLLRLPFSFGSLSCTPTKSSRFAQKFSTRWSCSARLLSRCGASRWRQNSSRMPTVRTSYAAMSAGWKTKVSLYRTVSNESEREKLFNYIKTQVC